MKVSKDKAVFNVFGYIILIVLSVLCLLPFIMILTGSFTSQESIFRDGYRLIPKEISLEAYKVIFNNPITLLRAYGVTIFVTVFGTFVSLFLTSMAAYVLASQDFKYRNAVSFYFYFTSIFGGGLVPWYILMIKYLHMKNNIFALILPMMLNMMYIIIMRSFIQSSIPVLLIESAKLDGAGDFKIYLKVILPLSKAGLSTIGLFTALNYWNDWYNAMLFIEKDKLFPLQYFLHSILSKADFLKSVAAQTGITTVDMPSEPMKLAMTVIATGPIIILYPFLQKYFVKGVTIGAVKG